MKLTPANLVNVVCLAICRTTSHSSGHLEPGTLRCFLCASIVKWIESTSICVWEAEEVPWFLDQGTSVQLCQIADSEQPNNKAAIYWLRFCQLYVMLCYVMLFRCYDDILYVSCIMVSQIEIQQGLLFCLYLFFLVSHSKSDNIRQ